MLLARGEATHWHTNLPGSHTLPACPEFDYLLPESWMPYPAPGSRHASLRGETFHSPAQVLSSASCVSFRLEPMRVKRGECGAVPEENWRSPRKPTDHRYISGTIPTCENPGVTPPGFEFGLPRWVASAGQCRNISAQENWRSPRKPADHRYISGTIPTCENPGVTPPGIELGLPWWESKYYTGASMARRSGWPARLSPRRTGFNPRPGHSRILHMWESCRPMTLVGGFSRDLPFPPAFSFRNFSILISITPIGSQDVDDQSRPNLFAYYTFTKCLRCSSLGASADASTAGSAKLRYPSRLYSESCRAGASEVQKCPPTGSRRA
ncbi:hypothetical protein PR048_000810 [Dryococelus australis]|uniref:Uncharacterized protein n=1 Tax=Dryococelus australis TaxID=614101 RepID=A0ABQ9IG95_9NEOP|nr:hypothetical protein PR048_000810 [Dryococelus australis]